MLNTNITYSFLFIFKGVMYMFIPDIFKKSYVDDVFDDVFSKDFIKKNNNLMNTDIKELENSYELDIELPGFKKEDIKAEVKNGYLVINATHSESKDEKDKEGKFVRKERYSGHCSRSFYLGDDITEKDIDAKFKNGVLKLIIPKKQLEEKSKEKKYVAIED